MIALLIAAVILLLAYRYYYMPRFYWSRKNVPAIAHWPFIGNVLGAAPISKPKSFFDACKEIHRATNDKYVGIYFFNYPVLFVKDPELIRTITIKHFDHFVNHSTYLFNFDTSDVLRTNLFSLNDDDWRKMRATLSPTFTVNKMRTMYPLVQAAADNLCRHFTKHIELSATGCAEFHAKNPCGRYTNDVIASCAFGIHVNSLDDQNNKFYVMGKRATQMKLWKVAIMNAFGADFLSMFNVHLFDKHATDYLVNVFEQTIQMRRERGIVRHDMVQLLLDAQKQSVERAKTDANVKVLTDANLLAHTFIFFFGGYDTTSNQLTMILLELAMNPHVQHKLYEEIQRVYDADGTFSFEKIMAIKYLDMIITESLRKWPSIPVLERLCTKDLTIDDVTIRRGDVVFLSAGNHWDTDIYPDALVFDPERFGETNERHPCTYLGFGSGPRHCVGQRFAMMGMKVMLANCVKHFEFVTTENSEVPIRIAAKLVTTFPNNDVIGVRARL